MTYRTLQPRLLFVSSILCFFAGNAFAQSDVNEIVISQQQGLDFNIYVDPHALEIFGDSVITTLNADNDDSWNTWKDVLTNGNSPGMNVNFDGWNAYGIDSLLVQGAAKLDSTLEVDGYVRMNDSLYVALYAMFQSKLSVGDSLVVAGGTDLNSTLDVDGDTEMDTVNIAGSLTVADDATFNSDFDLNGDLDVDGLSDLDTTDIDGSLDVQDMATFQANVQINDSLNVTNDAHIGGNFQVDLNTDLDGTLDVSGATGVDGNFDVNTDKFTVDATSGNTAVAGTMDVTGAATLSSTLDVDGDTDLDDTDVDGTLDVSGATGVDGNFDVATDKFTVDATSGNTAVAGTMGVTGAATLSSTLDVDGDTDLDDTDVDGTLDVTGATGVDGNFDVATDKFTVDATSGNTAVAGTMGVTGAATLSSTLDVDGDTDLDDTDVDGTLDVSGATGVDGNFDVATDKFTVDATSGNTAVAGTMGVTGAATLSSTLDVDGNTDLDDTDVDGTLDVSGATGVDGNFDVATDKFTVDATSGNTAVAGTMGVTGAATLSSTLDVDGNTDLDDTDVDGTLDVTGAAGVDGNFDVATDKFTVDATSGNTAVAGTMGVTGAATLSSTLDVDGNTDLDDTDVDGTLDVSGATGVDGNFDVATDKFTVDATSGNTAVAGTMGVTGAATLSSTLDVDGDTDLDDTEVDGTLDVTGATGVDGNFDVATDKFTVDATSGNTAVAGTMGVTGAATLSSTLDVDGNTDLDDTDVDGTLDVSGATGVDGNFDVATDKFTVDATSGNTAVAGTMGVTGAATLSSTLDVDGNTDLDDTDVDGTLDVSGATGVDGNFDVATDKFTVDATSGNTTIAGNLDVTGTANVASGSMAGTLTLADGSITDSNGSIDFGNNNLSTTGDLDISAGTLTLADGQVAADKVGGGSYPTSTYQHTASTLNYASTTMNLTAFAGFNTAAGTAMDIDGDLNISDATLTLAAGQVVAAGVGAGTFDAGTYSFNGSTISDLGTVTTADIDGGTIDGATISTSDVTVGLGKTLNMTTGSAFNADGGTYMDIDGILNVAGATLTLDAGQVGADKVGAGTFDAGTYSFAGSTISDLGTVTTADIDGGSISGSTLTESNITLGAGNTLNVAAGELLLNNGQVGADKVGPGTFNAGTYSFAGSTISDLGDVAYAYIHGGLITDTYITISSSGYLATNSGSTVDLSNASLTLADDQISGDAIDGGTIGTVTINQLNLASGAESPATRSTVLGQLIAAASSTNQPASAAPYNTGTYIDLPPGKWNVFINMQTDQGYNSFLTHGAGSGGGSIALGLSTSDVAYAPIASQFHTESLVGGSLDGDHSIYDMIQGQVLIDQSTGSTVRLYLWVKSIIDSSGNASVSPSTWTKPGSDQWDLNSLYAVPVNW